MTVRRDPRHPARHVWQVVAGATAMAVLTGLAVWAVSAPGCAGRLRLTVAVAPELAPGIREAGRRWAHSQPQVAGRCVKPTVAAVDPARVAASAARAVGGDLDVAGAASRAGRDLPQAWIPDSATWLARLRAIDRGVVPPETPSIALSPVLLALPEPAARGQGWPATEIGWDYLLRGMAATPPLVVGAVDPRRSAVGLSSLLSAGQAAASAAKAADADPRAAVRGAYRGLASAQATTQDQLLDRLPRDGGSSKPASTLSAALLPEWGVRAYDAAEPDVPLAAVYPEPAAPALDYPYAIMAAPSTAAARAAARFRDWLLADESQQVLTRRGFRTPDGSIGPDFPTGHGVKPEPVPPPRKVEPDSVNQALRLWAEVGLPSRTLALLDVSGSMTSVVPGAAGLTRLELARRAMKQALPLFRDGSELGLWMFATDLTGDQGHREVTPVRSLQRHREQIASALDDVTAKPDSGATLYGAALAAYAAAVAEHDAAKANTLVVITDGRDHHPTASARERLLTEWERLADPGKPVRVVAVGIGPDADKRELDMIASAAGGEVFLARDPATIGETLIRALRLSSS